MRMMNISDAGFWKFLIPALIPITANLRSLIPTTISIPKQIILIPLLFQIFQWFNLFDSSSILTPTQEAILESIQIPEL